MESRFAHLRQRDTSVSMLRVRMSRRRSQTQKENRERVVNTRRRLGAVQELDVSSLDASMALGNTSVVQEKKSNTNTQPKNVAGEERLKQLQRWKERKALEKEKEKREKGSKGVFKTGLYHPKDSLKVKPLPPVPEAPGRVRETKESAAPSSRVTRSMKQQQVPKPLKMLDGNTVGKKSHPPVERATRLRGAAPKAAPSHCKTKAEPASRGSSTRSTHRPPVTAALKDEPQDRSAGLRSTRSRAAEVAPPPAAAKTSDDTTTVPEESASKVEPEEVKACGPDVPPQPEEVKACGPDAALQTEEEEMAVEPTVPDSAPAAVTNSSPNAASFAPEGFLFQAPTGLSSFKFDPMTPRSADAFLTPSSSFTLPSAPVFDDEPQEEKKPSPPKSPRRSPPTADTEEQKHDVPYFRSQISSETARLTGLCAHWEAKTEDETIPEEMRDGMRTAVGQARLLMKERFKQFSGLVDDCEFSRGEKVTTCTDLQGFWDMVYFQVEDVNKKFDALTAAEARGWVEEYKPPPPQRKVVKKAAPAPSKPAGTKAAAKSRLAAAKAAMKARQQAALAEQAAQVEKAAQVEDTEQCSQEGGPAAESTDTVLNTGVESPAKLPVCVRRSSRLSAVALPPQSPSSNCLTPRRATRRSLALAQTPKPSTNPQTPLTHPHPENKTPAATPQAERSVHVPLRFSPVTEMSSDSTEQTEDVQSVPSVAVEQDKPAEDLDLSLRLSQSPCKSPVESPAPASSVSLSFSLSPCTAPLSSPAVSHTPGPAVSRTPGAQLNLQASQDSVAATPDCSVNEDLPGIDFERYLQPSQRDSLSPGQPFAMESPMAVDVEMESPRSQSEKPLTQQDAVSATLPSVPTLVSSQSPQTVESALLLFTADMNDRIRQSVCPSDLMVFTPPRL